MAQPLQLRRVTLLLRRTHHRPTTLPPPRFLPLFTKQPFSTTSTPYPLQYELIISRPIHPPPPHRRPLKSHPQHSNQPQEPNIPFKDFVDARLNKLNNLEINQENGENEGFIDIDKRGRRRMMGSDIEDFKQPQENNIPFEDLVDERLNNVEIIQENGENGENEGFIELDKRKRKYYNKRRRRMIGSDTEDEEYRGRGDDEFVELKQEVVELKTLHKREEELYFYDAFAYPWEKDKHYKMVYQLEKKYFPDQGFDKAFLDPGKRNADERKSKRAAKNGEKGIVENKMVFFEDKEKEGGGGDGEEAKVDVSEKKVGEFFKSLKKVPGEDAQPEPFLSTRRTGLPPQWDTPTGTVLLVNKPKGWTSFTVCGKLRRLVKVKKVGHAGTLDPMATGLLIVCVGKSTKIVDRYQGMTKGYSGIFRLGEATSTWDADSPVIQREPWEHVKDSDLKKAAESFCGEIWQVPPMFSAIKVGGEKLYEKARRGESLELSPRRISIFQFDIERSLDDRQNVIFRVVCSKGTYIRSLCADLGKALGSCAHLTALRRDSIGEYLADDAWDFKELEEEIVQGYM